MPTPTRSACAAWSWPTSYTLRSGSRAKHNNSGALKTQRLFRALDDSDWVIFWNTLPLRGMAPGHYRVGYALGEGQRAEVQWSDVWLDVR